MKRIKLCFCVAAVAVAAYGQDFEYDANGNLTKDRRKGLSFAYNRLNLLEKVWRGDSLLLCYHYLADETLLDVRDGSGKNGYDYVGSVVYKVTDGKREFDNAVVGDVWFTKDGVRYALTDQLGSVRALINEEGKVVERHDYYPLGTEQPHEGRKKQATAACLPGKNAKTGRKARSMILGRACMMPVWAVGLRRTRCRK